MSKTILLAAALQKWDQYSTHALAARDVAAAIARGSSKHIHVLSIYDYEDISTSGIPPEMVVNYREDQMRRIDDLMKHKIEEYVSPLRTDGIEISKILRLGDPRKEIVKVATEIQADLLIIGTHSKRGLLDIFLGGTAQQVSKQAPCTVVLVSPKK